MPEFTALTDLATVKRELAITNTNSDTQLNSLIASVSAAISVYCNRNFGTASYTETYDGSGTQMLWLNQRPVTAVSSVTVGGLTVVQRPTGYPAAYGWTFDQNQLFWSGGFFCEGFQNVTVVYTAGLAISSTNYPDLWQAAAEWVGMEYKGSQHRDKATDSGVDGQGTTYLNKMPWTVQTVVDRYRQVSPVQSLGIQ